jgi:glycosyltransferase involved in cell wall biosynthesis
VRHRLMSEALRIGVDGMPLSRPLTGVGNYTDRLVQRLAYEPDIRVTVGLYSTLKEPQPDLANLNHSGVSFDALPAFRSRVWSRAATYGVPLPYEAILPRQDLYIFPNFRSQHSRHPTVSVIHDFTFVRFPELVPEAYRAVLERVVPRTVDNSDLLVVPSPTIREEALSLYEADPSRTVVVPPLPPPRAAGVREPPRVKRILFVGTVEPRKNLGVLLRAAEIARLQGTDVRLDIVGGGDARLLHSHPGNGSWLRVHGYLGDDDLAHLFDTTAALAMPSWYEGYGMPIVEAMDRGVPVILSDLAVFRWIGGSAALYADPSSPDEWAHRLQDVTDDEAWRKLSAAVLGEAESVRAREESYFQSFMSILRLLAV